MNEFLMISYEIGKQRMQDFQREAENWRIAQCIKNGERNGTCQTAADSMRKVRVVRA
ncbi:MAG: hypothetical protein HXS40_01445 [Theionarchaea archaeon]|nr:hypothetical protein [Theionarchaea archaeon]